VYDARGFAHAAGYWRGGREAGYCRPVSGKMPQTYVLHSFAIAIVIIVAMVLFLRSQWGGH
jgi:hypothetical protein